jgi:hypothetical protein
VQTSDNRVEGVVIRIARLTDPLVFLPVELIIGARTFLIVEATGRELRDLQPFLVPRIANVPRFDTPRASQILSGDYADVWMDVDYVRSASKMPNLQAGQVRLRRGEHVTAQDGRIGRLTSIRTDSSVRVTAIDIQMGIFERRKHVQVPADLLDPIQSTGKIIRLSAVREAVIAHQVSDRTA